MLQELLYLQLFRASHCVWLAIIYEKDLAGRQSHNSNLGCMKFRRAKAFVPGGSLEVGCHVFDHRCWPPRAASCTTEQIRCNCKVFFLFVVVVTHIFERNAVSMRHMETLSSQKSAGKFARTKQPTRRRAILRLQALPVASAPAPAGGRRCRPREGKRAGHPPSLATSNQASGAR